MHVSVILQDGLDILYLNVQVSYLFVDQQALLLGCFEVILNDLSILLDLEVAILDHLSQVCPQLVDIIILQLDLLRNSLSQRSHIPQHFAALLHTNVQDFELFIDVLGRLLDLS